MSDYPMIDQMKIHNFSAGPCILPKEVLDQASHALLEFNNSGLSLIEMSHRSADFVEVMERARSLVRELLDVPEDYEILFLQGGASLGFYMAALNFLKDGGTAAYINTGTWSTNAIKEAKTVGEINVVASSEDKKFTYIPKSFVIPEGASYLHFTSNNTIFGTQFQTLPEAAIPRIVDMSSDIFSREFKFENFALVYAGAQKNMGPAGTTLFIVKKDLLGKTNRIIPSILDFNVHISKDSMFNTPPVFAVYVSMLTLQWLKNLGGVKAIEKINNEKANLIYNEIDRNSLFVGVVEKEDRSRMNATFQLTDQKLSGVWEQKLNLAGISGLNGHRSVGGYRASMYNALPVDSVKVLVDVMKDLEKTQA